MVSLQGTISLMHEIAGYIDWLSKYLSRNLLVYSNYCDYKV